MVIIDYNPQRHRNIIKVCAYALKQGKAVVYPTDTSYGLAVDATNGRAIKKLYKIKGRNFSKPVHVMVPSVAYAKKIVKWNATASKLAGKFWPGALTLVLPVGNGFKPFPTKTGYLGIRMPNNQIALDLSKNLKRPITATSANRSGQPDCYTAGDVIKEFQKSKFKPDIIINAGKLPRRKPSTLLKIDGVQTEILRRGPISYQQIMKLAEVSKSKLS